MLYHGGEKRDAQRKTIWGYSSSEKETIGIYARCFFLHVHLGLAFAIRILDVLLNETARHVTYVVSYKQQVQNVFLRVLA